MSARGAEDKGISFLPDFCTIQGVFSVVVVAQSLAFLLEFSSSHALDRYWSGLGIRSMFIQWVALSSAAILCGLRPLLEQYHRRVTMLTVFMIIQSVTLVVSGVVYLWASSLGTLWSVSIPSLEFFFRNLGVSSIVALLLLRYLYVQFQWKRQQYREQEARLDALQSRIRPHFLFNSLNTIASLTRVDPPLAEDLVQDLAELFRASLTKNRKYIRIDEEFELVQQYLNIEQQRLGSRLRVEMDLEQVPGDARIPPLTLQPLVENAVYHGIEPAEHGGRIWMEGRRAGQRLILTVKNTLPGDSAGRTRSGNRIAVENVDARIRGCFPDEGQVLISRADDCYHVRVVLPYRTEPE